MIANNLKAAKFIYISAALGVAYFFLELLAGAAESTSMGMSIFVFLSILFECFVAFKISKGSNLFRILYTWTTISVYLAMIASLFSPEINQVMNADIPKDLWLKIIYYIRAVIDLILSASALYYLNLAEDKPETILP